MDARAGVEAEPWLELLGRPRLRVRGTGADWRPERRFQLLALLALRRGEWVTRERIAALLWPDRGPAEARRNLRKVVHDAHSVPGAQGMEVNDHALRWQVASDYAAVHEAVAAQRWADALALQRGALLAGQDDPRNAAFGEWLDGERRALEALLQRAAHAALAQAAADAPARAALAARLLAKDPLDEVALTALLEAEQAQGHTGRAQRAFRDYAERLAAELGVEPSRRLRNLALAVQSSEPADDAASNPSADFIGRRAELNSATACLDGTSARLLTMTGPGGVGKSRLARQVLARCGGCFPGGAHWIELQDLEDLTALTTRIARGIGLAPGAVGDAEDAFDSIAALARSLAGAPALLVLDNAEHLRELPRWLAQLRAQTPALSVLLTSRVRTRVPDEEVLTLDGLAVPDDESRDLEAATAFDALRLFDARARRAQRGFRLAEHLAAAIDIVEAVAGLPLAIELAVAWVRLLPPAQIARELRGSLDVLERDPASAAAAARPEHASVRAVLERSWQLLAPSERDALIALAVFHGGFTREAARAVAGVSLPLLSSLIDKSLVSVDAQGRFGLHPLVAADARERGAAAAAGVASEGPSLHLRRDRHADYFGRLATEWSALAHSEPRRVLDPIAGDFANLRAAWQHAVETSQWAPLAAMVGAWRHYFDVLGRYGEGVALIGAALVHVPQDGAALQAAASVRNALSVLLFRKRDLDQALAVAHAGIEMAERCKDRRSLVGCLSNAGSSYSMQGRWPLARPLFERALVLATEDGERGEMANSLLNLGVCDKKDGHYERAIERYERALAVEQELGRHVPAARCLNNIGVVQMEREDWAGARRTMERGLRLCELHRIDSLAPYLENGLGLACYELGELDAAERHLGRAAERARATEVSVVEMNAGEFLARVATRRGQHALALERFRKVARLAVASDSIPDQIDLALYFGEYLRDTGQRVQAARAWRLTIEHPMVDAGVRNSAEKCLAGLTREERDSAEREPLTLEALMVQLTEEETGAAAAKR